MTPDEQAAANTIQVVSAVVDAFAEAAEALAYATEKDGVRLARWAQLTPDEQELICRVLHKLFAPLAAILETSDGLDQ